MVLAASLGEAHAGVDYSKLLGFDMVSDELAKGVDFNNPTVGAKLGAKVGKTVTKADQPMVMDPPTEVGPGAPIMRGLDGREVPAPDVSKAIQSGLMQSRGCEDAR